MWLGQAETNLIMNGAKRKLADKYKAYLHRGRRELTTESRMTPDELRATTVPHGEYADYNMCNE